MVEIITLEGEKDIMDLTVRDLADLAAQIRAAAVGSEELSHLVARMTAAGAYLLGCGALVQMRWWVDPGQMPDPLPTSED